MWSPAGGDKPRPYIAAFEDIPRRGRHPRAATLAPAGQFAFGPHRPAAAILHPRRRDGPCGRLRAGTNPAPTLRPLKISSVGADTPGRPLLPLWGNSPSAHIGPRQLSSTLAVGAALVAARGRGQVPPLHTGAGYAPLSGPPHEPSEAVRVGKRRPSGGNELSGLPGSE